jgi:uncharacterized protein (DUF2147 family)
VRKHILILCILSLPFSIIISQPSDDICGYWRTVKGNTQFQISKNNNGKYAGKIVWLRVEKDRNDFNNPDIKLRQRKVLGLLIMNNFSYNEKKKAWENGTIYDPENGKTYICKLWFEKDKFVLYLRGYINGIKVLRRETNWIRESKLHP